MLFVMASCSFFDAKELVKLPKTNSPNSLDSSQARAVYDRAQYFPNGTQLSLCIITGDTEKYVGIERRNILWCMLKIATAYLKSVQLQKHLLVPCLRS